MLLLSDLLGHLLLLIVLLGVEEGVGQEKLLGVHLVIFAYLLSVEGFGTETQFRELVFEPYQLIEEIGPDLEVGSPEMHELQGFIKRSSKSIG